MIRSKTVFVVGAGASKELGFPIGEDLLSDIAEGLNFKIDYSNEVERGDRQIWNALVQEVAGNGQRLDAFRRAAWRVRDAAHLGLSIDNVIHQQNDDEMFAICAKLGIARRILDAEETSCLKMHDNNRTMTWPDVRGTWLSGFAQLLVQDVERQQIDSIFDNVSVICFNYDRTIRQFLPYALTSQFAIEESQAAVLTSNLRVFHPYGSLGPLELEGRPGTIRYGGRHADLRSVAANIRTFTEQIEDEEDLAAMRRELDRAERIVFLGFGYLTQNMSLLLEQVSGNARQILGTSYGLSEPDRELVTGHLDSLLVEHHRAHKSAQLFNLKCADFIRENFRSITA